MKTIAVFCGSRAGNNPVYRHHAAETGRLLAQNGYEIVYGDVAAGLMGVMAQAARDEGGTVYSIVTKAFSDDGAYPKINGCIRIPVEDGPARTAEMIRRSDAFLCLSGGNYTLTEIANALGAQDMKFWGDGTEILQPVVILNSGGLYNCLRDHFRAIADAGFVSQERAELATFLDTPEAVVDFLNERRNAPPLRPNDLKRPPAP